MEKKNSRKPRHYSVGKPVSGGIVLPKELLDMYDELPSQREVNRAEKRKEYVESLSEEDRKKYAEASSIAKTFQRKYMFTENGNKCFPFTFNFRSKFWTITWDRIWLEKAAKVPELLNKIEHLIEQCHQLAPREKDKDGNDIILADANGNPILSDKGTQLFKTKFDASKTYDRK